MQYNEILIHAVPFVLTIIRAIECLQSVASKGAQTILANYNSIICLITEEKYGKQARRWLFASNPKQCEKRATLERTCGYLTRKAHVLLA